MPKIEENMKAAVRILALLSAMGIYMGISEKTGRVVGENIANEKLLGGWWGPNLGPVNSKLWLAKDSSLRRGMMLGNSREEINISAILTV